MLTTSVARFLARSVIYVTSASISGCVAFARTY